VKLCSHSGMKMVRGTRIVTAMDKQNVDPALWPLVEGFPPINVSAETLPGFRAAFRDMSPMPDPATYPDVRITTCMVPGGGAAAQSIRCLQYAPAQQAVGGALLHVHGGGYVIGPPEMDAARNIALVRATGCTILSVDYRLAPEHPHPAALEDCHAALLWLAAQLSQPGLPAPPIGVIGESAGGGLAAALALLARDRQSVALVCQVLVYPMLVPPTHSVDTVAPDARTGRFIWSRESNGYCWGAYLARAPVNPATIAGLAPDVSRLPPAFLAVGEFDLFVHDNLAYAGRLMRAGCAVEAHVYPGAIHGFDRAVDAEVSQRYTRELVAFIRRHLA
jgi:acetyl esterase/lipase